MLKLLFVLTILVSLALVACGGPTSDQDDFSLTAAKGAIVPDAPAAFSIAGAVPTPAATPAPTPAATRAFPPMPAPAMAPTDAEAVMAQSGTTAPAFRAEGQPAALMELETAQRKVISMASISVEVEDVPLAVNQVRAVAEGLGGFVEQLSSTGGDEPRASLTVRVPQDQFFAALDLIREIGEVQSENVGSEDVTEQFIDL